MTYDEEMRTAIEVAEGYVELGHAVPASIAKTILRALSRPVDADVERRIRDALSMAVSSQAGQESRVERATQAVLAIVSATHPHPDRCAEAACKAALDRIANTQRETFASPDEHGLWCKRTVAAALASLSESNK